MGFFIITAVFLGVLPLENDLRLISGFHSEILYSIKILNTKLNGDVKEIFAYVVASNTYEKEEFLKREEHFKKNQKKFFPITKQTIDKRGEAREEERALYDKIISGKIVLVKHAKIMVEVYEKTRTVFSQVMQQH